MNYPPFHLTINQYGVVSLLDTERTATTIMGEIYVRFELTAEQCEALKAATEQAKRLPKRGR